MESQPHNPEFRNNPKISPMHHAKSHSRGMHVQLSSGGCMPIFVLTIHLCPFFVYVCLFASLI